MGSNIQEEIKALFSKGWERLFIHMNEAIELFERARALSEEVNDIIGIATYKVNISIVHYQRGELELAYSLCMEALAVFEEHPGHFEEECGCYFGLGNFYWNVGIRDKGIYFYTKSYELGKASGIKELEGRALGFLATSYYDVKEYETALRYAQEVQTIYEFLNQPVAKARNNISIGCIYRELGDIPKAISYLNAGASISIDINYSMGIARAYNELATSYSVMHENEKALEYYKQSLEIRVKIDQKQGILSTQLDIANFYADNHQLEQAITIIEEALVLAKSLDAKSKIQRAYELLSIIYEKQNKIEQALYYFKAYHAIKNEIDHSDAEAKLNNIRLSDKAEQSEKEAQIVKQKNKELAEMNHKLEETNIELDLEKDKSDRLLLNILPESIAQRLKNGETLIADSFREVTVLFADIAGFTQLSAELSPDRLVQFLNRLFLCFDKLIVRHDLDYNEDVNILSCRKEDIYDRS